MKPFPTFTTGPGAGPRPITFEQAAQLFSPDEIAKGEARGTLKTVGPWQIPVSFAAIATWQDFSGGIYHEYAGRPVTVYGRRTLSKPKQSGHVLEGTVSVGGKRYRGFTSSQLFALPGGRLINAKTIHVCKPDGAPSSVTAAPVSA